MMWRHFAVRRLLDPFVDRELPRHRMRQVAAHVAECWRCDGRAQTLRLVKQVAHRLGGPSPESLTAARLHRFAREISVPSAT
jgi:anti-sigma factor RsiW